MTRKKIDDNDRLVHTIGVRVSDSFLKKMKGWLSHSNCQTIAELARHIICKEKIIWYHKDEASENLAVEMTAIRKELNAIGNNINQVTRYFNSTANPSQKIFESLKILDEYQKVKVVVDKLTVLINQLNHGRQSD